MPSKSLKKSVTVVKSSISKQSYQDLVAVLRQEMKRGAESIQKHITFEKIRTNWNMGRYIDGELQGSTHAPRHFYDRLSRDLNISTRHLQDIVNFYRVYPKMPLKSGLSWTQYNLLAKISDPSERKHMERRVIKEGTTVDELRLLVHAPEEKELPASQLLKAPGRGALFAYRIVKVNPIVGKGYLTLDCGFDVALDWPLDKDAVYNSGCICLSNKKDEVYTLLRSNVLHVTDIYTYCAAIERFIDGDTLLVSVDVGFGITIRQKLRFRLIDCPEMGTQQGERAKAFVEEELKDCPFVVVKTYKADKYDRYLVDVFYLPKEADAVKVARDGKYLNQELINKGLAKVWKT